MPLHKNLSIEDRVSAMITEYAPIASQNVPYDPSLSLRNSFGLESLVLVSVILRMGFEFDVDVTDFALELNSISTVGDLYSLAHKLQNARPSSLSDDMV